MTGGAPSDSAASSDTPLKTNLMETLSSVKAGPCGDEIYCMVTHQHLPRHVVTGEHLLPRAWNTLNKTLFGFADIDDVRNGVLMLGVIARAYARFQLCLIPQLVPPLSYAIVVHVLDPNLRNKTLVSALPQEYGECCPSNAADDAQLTALLTTRLGGTTFGDLHGTKVTADPDRQTDYPSDPLLGPYARVLYWQTLRCMCEARQKRWPAEFLPQLDIASIAPGYAERVNVWQACSHRVSGAVASDAAGSDEVSD
ncbi:hypothetical protein JKP88DRAFT_347763 [Tribonema minus]|uniref:Uncharacterized protein n=1 Tax=Tribonema minus TaxID=303371 RepID=A0A836CK55_9STRA|nr:hypothetical protein JKP88DRAFT_347763 [Tribonema minus]